MAGDESRVALEIDAGLLLEHAHRRERDRHQRRLRVFGQRQRIRRTVPDDVAEPLAQRRIDFFENPPRRRKRLGQGLAHADGLTALAGKNKRGRHMPDARLQTRIRLTGKGRKIPG